MNKLRKEHGSPPLTYSSKISDYSQSWSNKILSGKNHLSRSKVPHQPHNKYTFDLVVSKLFRNDDFGFDGRLPGALPGVVPGVVPGIVPGVVPVALPGVIPAGLPGFGIGGDKPVVEFTADAAFKYALANQTYPWYGREPPGKFLYLLKNAHAQSVKTIK